MNKVNPVSVILLLVAAAAVYAGILFYPVLMELIDVKEALGESATEFQSTDEEIRQHLISRLEKIGTHLEENEAGFLEEKQGLEVDPQGVEIDRDAVGHSFSIRLRYVRAVRLLPSQRHVEVTMTSSHHRELP